MLWVAGPRGRALHLSCGAALFNLRIAIRMLGARPLVWPLPDPDGEPTLLASVQLADGRPATPWEREMFDAIALRHTSRAPFSGRPIPVPVRIGLEQEAGAEFASLRMLTAADAAVVLELAAAADSKLAANYDHRVELGRWIGTTGDDGVPAGALGSRPDRAPAPVRDLGYAAPAVGRPQAASSRGRSSPCCPPRAMSLPTGCGPGRHCSGCCWRRPSTGSPRPSSTSRWSCATSTARTDWWPWPEFPQIIIRLGYGPTGATRPGARSRR